MFFGFRSVILNENRRTKKKGEAWERGYNQCVPDPFLGALIATRLGSAGNVGSFISKIQA